MILSIFPFIRSIKVETAKRYIGIETYQTDISFSDSGPNGMDYFTDEKKLFRYNENLYDSLKIVGDEITDFYGGLAIRNFGNLPYAIYKGYPPAFSTQINYDINFYWEVFCCDIIGGLLIYIVILMFSILHFYLSIKKGFDLTKIRYSHLAG